MKVMLHDGSIEGLLTAIYDSYYSKPRGEKIYFENDYEISLLDHVFVVKTEKEKSDKVAKAIVQKISEYSFLQIITCFLSEKKESSNIIFEYVKLGFKIGKDVEMNLADDRVNNFKTITRQVDKESHLFLGILRFQELNNNILYSVIEPDNNILAFLADHFAQRNPSDSWVIHDVKREIAAIYNKEKFFINSMSKEMSVNALENYSEKELFFQECWKVYHKTIAIESRENRKVQKNFLPRRYWKNLIEDMN